VVEAADHVEVLEAREVLVDRGVLPRQADPRAQRGRLLHHVEPRDAGAAGVGDEQRGEDPHRGRLARPVGAEQAEHRALLHLQVDPVEGDDVAVGLREPFRADRSF
jgi:hypothetical protein